MFKAGNWVVPLEDIENNGETLTKDTVYVVEEKDLEFYNSHSDKFELVTL